MTAVFSPRPDGTPHVPSCGAYLRPGRQTRATAAPTSEVTALTSGVGPGAARTGVAASPAPPPSTPGGGPGGPTHDESGPGVRQHPGPGHEEVTLMPNPHPTPRHHPVSARIYLEDLADARATVVGYLDPANPVLTIGDTATQVVIITRADTMRRLLTDALAQLDAIGAGQ